MRAPERGDAVDQVDPTLPTLGTLFDAARGYQAPTELRQRLLAAYGLPATPPAHAPPQPTVAVTTKSLIGLAVIAALAGAGAVVYRTARPAHAPATSMSVSLSGSAAADRPRAMPPSIAATTPGAQPAAREQPAIAGPVATGGAAVEAMAPPAATEAPRTIAAAGAPRTELRARHIPGRGAPRPARAATPAPAGAPAEVEAPPSAEPIARDSAAIETAPPTIAPVAPARLSDEIDLLDRAEAAVRRGDFRGALARLGEHYRRFPAGTLTQEAEVLRIAALFGAGRRGEAEARARRFLGLHSDGVLAIKVRSMLARDSSEAP